MTDRIAPFRAVCLESLSQRIIQGHTRPGYQRTSNWTQRHQRRYATVEATPSKWSTAFVQGYGNAPARHGGQKDTRGASMAPLRKALVPGGEISSRAMEQELRYLKDPMKLADHIRLTLRDGKLNKAIEQVRMAGQDMQCTVSWNHLIDFQMADGKVNAALKTYNEMKKRGQIPDSYTYLLIFRGLAKHAHYPQALEKALSMYHSMSGDKSHVRPSIIHTNAVLKVCARANNLDALWGIASKLSEHGINAPNNLTWTTVLNAVQRSAVIDSETLKTPEERSKRRAKAVIEGRRMWDDIAGKWRKGDIWIDEELVCAMGRLLLVGDRAEDWDDVLSLVEQAMAVPRLIPRLGEPGRDTTRTPQLAAPTDPESDDGDLQPGEEFRVLTAAQSDSGGKRATSLTYAVPGKNTLSLVVEASTKMRIKQTASDYWTLLTGDDKYKIQPDLDNFHVYMRTLRFSRSSGEVLELMRSQMPRANVEPTKISFWIALSTCTRDKNNPNVLNYAGQFLDMMQNGLEDPDFRTMRLYLELAMATDHDTNIVKALHRLGPGMVNIRSLLVNGWASNGKPLAPDTKLEVLALLRKIVGCYDRLLSRQELDRERKEAYYKERSKIAAYATRYSDTNAAKPREPASARNVGRSTQASRDNFSATSPTEHSKKPVRDQLS